MIKYNKEIAPSDSIKLSQINLFWESTSFGNVLYADT